MRIVKVRVGSRSESEIKVDREYELEESTRVRVIARASVRA